MKTVTSAEIIRYSHRGSGSRRTVAQLCLCCYFFHLSWDVILCAGVFSLDLSTLATVNTP
jgi:hypothetical protein